MRRIKVIKVIIDGIDAYIFFETNLVIKKLYFIPFFKKDLISEVYYGFGLIHVVRGQAADGAGLILLYIYSHGSIQAFSHNQY